MAELNGDQWESSFLHPLMYLKSGNNFSHAYWTTIFLCLICYLETGMGDEIVS